MSGDEAGYEDGLEIKPPQPLMTRTSQRSRDGGGMRSWKVMEDRQQNRRNHQSQQRRRGDYYHHHRDRERTNNIEESRSRIREHGSTGTTNSKDRKRHYDDMDRRDPSHHRRTRSKELHKSVKEKRRHLEEEEERTLREIQKRHKRETIITNTNTSSSTTTTTINSITKKEDNLHDERKTTISTKHEEEEESNSKEVIVVEDIIQSSPEEGEDMESDDEDKQNTHSDLSSDESQHSINQDKNDKSEDSSESSEDSTNSDSSDDEESNNNNNARSDEGGDVDDIKKSKSLSPLPLDKRENTSIEDESLLTDVDRAIREVNLLPPYYPAVQGCRRVEEFSLLNRIEEGTYGVVYRAKDRRTNEVVALKRLKMEKEKDGFPITSLREINTLLKAQHENIVTVREIVVGSNTDKIFLVMDYVEHDLKSLMETLKQKNQIFLPEEVKCLMIQLLKAVAHLHDNWILHRDLKTSNLLLSHKGILKVGDFGLAREYGSPLKSYTPIVVTLWYRAPELLLGVKEYSTAIDVWSVGCIFGELLKLEPMFPGKSEANQLNLIFQTLGTPNDRIWPGYSQLPLLQRMTFVDQPLNKLRNRFSRLGDTGVDLMNRLLTYNPMKRLSAEEGLSHPFFKEPPLPIDPSVFPTWPAKSELGHRKAPSSPKPPSGGRQFKDLRDEEDSSGFFFGSGTSTGERRLPTGAGFSLKF